MIKKYVKNKTFLEVITTSKTPFYIGKKKFQTKWTKKYKTSKQTGKDLEKK